MCARLPIHAALNDALQVPSPQHVRLGMGIGMRQCTVTAGSQTITLNPPTQVATTIGSSVAITAIGGASGNAVSFAISTTSAGICSLTNNGATGTAPNLIGNATITVLTLGDCTIIANQAGNTNFNAALSVSVTITLVQPSAQLYFIHPDHLGTPRAITKASNNTKVWEWNNDDAFGNNPPDENPNNVNGTTPFKYNLRFPGQYFDIETNTHYNDFRDYDPATGRYLQSDPIGLNGGINTYAYVEGNPLSYVDADGLKPRPQGTGGNSAQRRFNRRNPKPEPLTPSPGGQNSLGDSAGYYNTYGDLDCV